MNDINWLALLAEYAVFLIPLIFVQFGLMIAALIHIFRHKNYKTGNRLLWVVLVVCINFVGPIIYFVLGRAED